MINMQKYYKALPALILATIIINAARYIFNFGSPLTSSGYQPTPMVFWAVKYTLILGIISIISLNINNFNKLNWGGYSLVFIFTILGAFKADSQPIHIAAVYVILYGLLYTLASSNHFVTCEEQIINFKKTLWIIAGISLLFLLMQLALYFSFDILPSHSHRNSIVIRFGSILDDSLALGVLLPMFAGLYFYSLRDESGKIISLCMICLVSVLTGSVTAMVTTAGYTVWIQRKTPYKALAWLVVICLSIITFRWYFHELWLAKAGSIAIHLESIGDFVQGNGKTSSTSNEFTESGWLLIYKNFGIVVLSGIILFHVHTFWACHNLLKKKTHPHASFIGAVEGLNLSALIASFNLPVIMIFPIYMLLGLFSAAVIQLNKPSGK